MINSSVEYGCFKCCLVFCSYRNSSNGSYFQGTKISRIINFTFTIATYFQISSSPVNIYVLAMMHTIYRRLAGNSF